MGSEIALIQSVSWKEAPETSGSLVAVVVAGGGGCGGGCGGGRKG